ncbi:MAG: hypothetical protein R2748_16195 [Bryobacterales bacterium]
MRIAVLQTLERWDHIPMRGQRPHLLEYRRLVFGLQLHSPLLRDRP